MAEEAISSLSAPSAVPLKSQAAITWGEKVSGGEEIFLSHTGASHTPHLADTPTTAGAYFGGRPYTRPTPKIMLGHIFAIGLIFGKNTVSVVANISPFPSCREKT